MNNDPFTALVEFEIRPENNSMEEWLQVWRPRGEDALTGEPDTTAYAALRSTENPNQVLIFERYAQGEESLAIHSARPAHQQLMDTMGSRNMTRRRVMSNLYADIEGYGWWARPEYRNPLRDPDLSVTFICTRFRSEQMRERYIQLTGEHAAYCQQNEPGTLIYSGGLALRDADRGPEIKEGDLLFVAAFADQEAAVKHRDDPAHLALQPELEKIERERVFVQTYHSTDNGYLWSV